MGVRENIEESVQGLIDFGLVKASSITDSIKQVVVTILGTEAEQRSNQVLYGNAAILLRPAAGDGMEVVYVRSGDDMVPVAHRETRWQVDLEEGEVVVRALGEDAGKVRLKAGGDVVIESATSISLGDGATEGVALGDALKSWLDNHQHQYTDTQTTVSGGSGSPAVGVEVPTTATTQKPTASSPDPSSLVKVLA